jgi:hypothetical protein
MAKVAQQQLLIQLRPVLSPSRREDPTLKVNFGDLTWVQLPGGGAVGEGGQRAISRFLALPVERQLLTPPGDHHDQAETAGSGWLASASRHWSLDRSDER